MQLADAESTHPGNVEGQPGFVKFWPSGDAPDFPEVSLAAGTWMFGCPKLNDYGVARDRWASLVYYGSDGCVEIGQSDRRAVAARCSYWTAQPLALGLRLL